MRLYRMLVELDGELRTYLVVASDHHRAWRALWRELPFQRRRRASLEELEAQDAWPERGEARVLRWWAGGAPLAPRAA